MTHKNDAALYFCSCGNVLEQRCAIISLFVSCCLHPCPGGETGRRTGLKIRSPERDVRVQFPPRAPTTLGTSKLPSSITAKIEPLEDF